MNRPESVPIPRRLSPIWLLLLLALGALRAAAQPVFSLDPVWCLGPAGTERVLEINLMVQRSSLAWVEADGGLGAGWEAQLVLERAGAPVADTVWTRRDWRLADREPGSAEKVPDQIRLALPTGSGRLRVQLRDLHSGLAVEKSLRLAAPAADGRLSEILLGVSLPDTAASGPFRRGGWRFLPYADGLYGAGLDTLRGLLEIRSARPADSLQLSLALLGERRNRLESRLPRALSSFPHLPGDPQRVVFSLPVTHLPSGSYQVEATLTRDGALPAVTRRAFWVHNPDVAAPAPTLDDAEFATAAPEELARQWEAAQVLASHYELEAWDRLDLEARRTFLREFWLRRDPDPATLVNEEQVSLLSRLEEARLRYVEPGPDGGLSDRARIFMRYGPPDAVETDFAQLNSRFNFDLSDAQNATGADHRDFELWLYNRLDGGVEFIFIDQRGFGTFELVHSTKSGEYYDPSWSRKLFP
ncbi:MAG: GWxTD domain-containing protein [Candidatus Delongbacteria bacterium]